MSPPPKPTPQQPGNPGRGYVARVIFGHCQAKLFHSKTAYVLDQFHKAAIFFCFGLFGTIALFKQRLQRNRAAQIPQHGCTLLERIAAGKQ
jgi:hypothetical protein